MPRTIQTVSDLVPDEQNANTGTERGQWTLRESLIRYAVGRGVPADRENG